MGDSKWRKLQGCPTLTRHPSGSAAAAAAAAPVTENTNPGSGGGIDLANVVQLAQQAHTDNNFVEFVETEEAGIYQAGRR